MKPDIKFTGRLFGKALIAQGVVPENVSAVSLEVPVDGVLTLHCKIYVTWAMLEAITRAIQSLDEPERANAAQALANLDMPVDGRSLA